MLLQLPPHQRAVLVLRYWEQLTEAETAARLGWPEGTVKSAASRGLRRLRELADGWHQTGSYNDTELRRATGMNTDVEELLREGMERFTAGVQAPPGLARTAVRGSAAGGWPSAPRGPAGPPPSPPPPRSPGVAVGGARRRPAAPCPGAHGRVRDQPGREARWPASTSSFAGARSGGIGGPSISWAYGPRNRFEEFTGSGCGHALPDGYCTHRGGSEPYLAHGTALIGGKLTGVYVTYYNREWSLLPEGPIPASACSRTGALEMGGPPVPTSDWPAFIRATLACGAATVTGHVQIDGVETLKITGSPVTVKLPPGEARAIREKWVRARWTLYVNPKTYLPVRLSGSERTYGGPAPSTYSTSRDRHAVAAADRRQHRQDPGHHPRPGSSRSARRPTSSPITGGAPLGDFSALFQPEPNSAAEHGPRPVGAMAAPARKEVARSCLVPADCLAGR